MVYFIQQRRYVSYHHHHHHQYYHRSDAVSFRGVMLSMLLLVLLSATSTTTTTNAAADTTDSAAKPNPLECELYIADSTIPGAGTGIFSGVAKDVGDLIGNGDKAFPIIDAWWHNGSKEHYPAAGMSYTSPDYYFNPTQNYVWDGASMGMKLEVFSTTDLAAFWPGIDAMVNCHAGLLNLEKATPSYDDGQLHRAIHPAAGAISPYDGGPSSVTRSIPQGGELFKSYGEQWFLGRFETFGNIPLQTNYHEIVLLLSNMNTMLQEDDDDYDDDDDNEEEDEEKEESPIVYTIDPSIVYTEILTELRDIWDSRTLNALHKEFTWEGHISRVIDPAIADEDEGEDGIHDDGAPEGNSDEEEEDASDDDDEEEEDDDNIIFVDMGILYQPNATRTLAWLNQYGKCIDHIIPNQSTIQGAGHGAFAKRDLPNGTVVTGTPLIHFPDKSWFDMYDFVMCDYNGTASPAQTEDGNANVGQHAAESVMVRNTNKDPYGKQLLLNYCYGHPDTTLILCPYGSGVNFINHARTGGSGESTKQKKNHEANVKIVWSQHGTTNQDDTWFTKDPSEMKIDYNTKVAFDYIATKDIQEGDEILLDYGPDFDSAWNEMNKAWNSYDLSFLRDYTSSNEYNKVHKNDMLRTEKEQETDPYPENILIRCHHILEQFQNGQSLDYLDDFLSYNYTENWSDYSGDSSGHECRILDRQYHPKQQQKNEEQGKKGVLGIPVDGRDEYYTVVLVNDNVLEKTISNVIRGLIIFRDRPYTTDLHMIGTFRHPIGIPDDILPDAWKNNINNKTCQPGYDSKECHIEDEEVDLCATIYSSTHSATVAESSDNDYDYDRSDDIGLPTNTDDPQQISRVLRKHFS